MMHVDLYTHRIIITKDRHVLPKSDLSGSAMAAMGDIFIFSITRALEFRGVKHMVEHLTQAFGALWI